MATDEQIADLLRAGKTVSQICEALKVGDKRIARVRRTVGGKPEINEVASFKESGDEAVATGTSDTPIKTLEDACRAANVDTKVWYVHDWEVSQWTTPLIVGSGPERKAIQQQQYRVRCRLKRILPKPLLDAAEAIYERLAKLSRKPANVVRCKPIAGEPCMAVVAVMDPHFGLLAWEKESGSNYDLAIAERLYSNAVTDLLNEVKGRNVAKILFLLGNDLLHVDNSNNTTFAGTPQSVDGRLAKLVETVEMAVINAIETAAAVAPVDVQLIPGNHDTTTSYHVARTVKAWFRHDKRVEVECGPSPRKYVRWGTNLIGLCHGDAIKTESLPNIMATEKPDLWAATTCREWILGHMHRSRSWTTQPIDTYEGTTVRVLRALTKQCAWHHKRGFVGGQSAAEVYFYGKERGYIGHAVAPARYE